MFLELMMTSSDTSLVAVLFHPVSLQIRDVLLGCEMAIQSVTQSNVADTTNVFRFAIVVQSLVSWLNFQDLWLLVFLQIKTS